MSSPFDPNCQGFHLDSSGFVVGVSLAHVVPPGATFHLEHARLLDEHEAGGRTVATVAVVDETGSLISARVYLAWPWGGSPDMPNRALPGNPHIPAEHVIASKYDPPNMGPLAIYVGDNTGKPISDVVGGLGLPYGHHVSYFLRFRRGEPDDDGGNGGGDGGNGDDTDILDRLANLEALVTQLGVHLGAWSE